MARFGRGAREAPESRVVREVPDAPPPVVESRPDVDVSVQRSERQNPVRWSAVWSGLVVGLATFLLVELIFFALGWLTFAQSNPGTTAGLVTWLIGVFAFLVGGMVAGATSIWGGAREGATHGVVLWGLATLSILFVTLFGGGALFSGVGDLFGDLATLGQATGVPDAQLEQIADEHRGAAGWGVLALVSWLVASIVGGVAGVKSGSKETSS